MITSSELRQKYLEFFKSKNHAIIPSSSLIPENDPTVLFTTAGMHPLVPYLLGEKHPQGNRLSDVQKCVRTADIDEVGDASHCTFFEMLGNWSLGDYFKKESIEFSFEFLTKVINIDISRLAVSVFEGDNDAPKDVISAKVWQDLGIKNENIYFLPKKNNWWGPAGLTGPCGPDTEIFIITTDEKCCKDCSPACDCGRYMEIWNNVFMEYFKDADGQFQSLSQKNVDTGMGLERTVAMLNGMKTVYETDVFKPVMDLLASKTLKDTSSPEIVRAMRVIADHIRTATFMIGDEKGISPSNSDQGYILRRLIRRAIRFTRTLEIDETILLEISNIYINIYKEYYSELLTNKNKIKKELSEEITKFSSTIQQGIKEFEKLLKFINNGIISGKASFRLYDTFGFPIEMTLEMAKEHNISVDVAGFENCFKEHQAKSQAGAEQKFKGGLADSSEETTKLHTATHLLLASLKKVLGDRDIQQKGSNITPERLRFDFNFNRPLTADELTAVENEVNRVIDLNLIIECKEMPIEEARKLGATGVFENKYQEVVKVYQISDFSIEMCGGPHAKNTQDLKKFKIIKEQSSSSGVRRIKAVLEN